MAGLRALIATCAALAAAALLTAPGAAAAPTPITVPGGVRPGHAAELAQQNTCVTENVCTIVKDTTPGHPSCTGYSSQTVPPTTIRVLVRTGPLTGTGTYTIQTVPFEQYVENVLPDEWVPSWDGDALKAGAVAVKSYGWYWVTHYGGYVNKTDQCFDVTDDFIFQTYNAGSANTRTTAAVQETWPVVARMNGQVIQASYAAYLHALNEGCAAYANGTQMSQYGTQACVEASSGNKYNVILQKYYYKPYPLQLATTRQLRTPHDFTFEQTSTRVTFSSGHWLLDDGYNTAFGFGFTGDEPVITDNGDGFAHIGVWRPSNGTWYLGGPTGAVTTRLQWGWRGDIPVPGHYTGLTSPSVVAVFRPSNATWYIHGQPSFVYGQSGDIPVPADYNGNGTTEAAVFRPTDGTWHIRGQSTPVQFGWKGDITVPGDYNGDGTADLAVYRPSNHTWYVRGSASVVWGWTGDIPVVGDFTGDGKADITVYRPSNHTWYTRGQAGVPFGPAGAKPIGSTPYSQ